MTQAPAPGLPPGVGEILAVIVAGGLGWAALCYREFRGLEDRVQTSIAAFQERLARESGSHLATVMRGGLVPLIDAYFEQRPTEVPAPFTADDLRFIAMQLDGDPGLALLTLRRSVTQPVVQRVVAGVLESLADLASSVVLTPEMVDAAFDLGSFPAQFDDHGRQARYLTFRYLGQVVALVAWAGTVLGAASSVLDPAVPALLGVVAAMHGISLEVSRRRLERRLRPSQSIGKALES